MTNRLNLAAILFRRGGGMASIYLIVQIGSERTCTELEPEPNVSASPKKDRPHIQIGHKSQTSTVNKS